MVAQISAQLPSVWCFLRRFGEFERNLKIISIYVSFKLNLG